MKLTVDDVSIDFFNFDYSNLKIGIAVSGGTDSALLLYLAARYLKDVEIIPWSGYEIENRDHGFRPFTIDNAIDVVQIVKEKLPTSNISKHHIWTYDRCGINKSVYMKNEIESSIKNGIIDIYVTGYSANPPIEVVQEWDTDVPVERFDFRDTRPNNSFYAPFANINKKFIASLYKKYDLMDDLFPYTASCVGWAEETNWFTEPCKKCFWCHERKWAFGYYDGEKKL